MAVSAPGASRPARSHNHPYIPIVWPCRCLSITFLLNACLNCSLAKSIPTDLKQEPFNLIPKVEWRTVRNGDAYIMFSGGLPIDDSGASSRQIMTVIHGKSTTILEMEHDIIDFITLCESPYEADYNDPYAIVVLLSNDLVVVNLQSPGWDSFILCWFIHQATNVHLSSFAVIPAFKIHTQWTCMSRLSHTAFIWQTVPQI